MATISNSSDVYNTQQGVINTQTNVLGDMKGLANQAAGTTDQGQLMKIQNDIDDDKRKYEVLKSINETLKGVQEDGSKFPQAR